MFTDKCCIFLEDFSSQTRVPKRQSKMYNPEKWIPKGTVDEDKQNENTTQDVMDTTMHKPTQIT
jgi:hypothetical protein